MEKGIILLLIGLVVLGLVAGLVSMIIRILRGWSIIPKEKPEEEEPYVRPAGCCGRHAVCEHEGEIKRKAMYFDDEELDLYRGVAANAHSEEAEAEFREIFETMCPSDLEAWLRSLERREINLPEGLQASVEHEIRELKERLSGTK